VAFPGYESAPVLFPKFVFLPSWQILYSCFSNNFPGSSASSLLVHNLSLAPRQPFLKPLLLFGFSLSAGQLHVSKPNPRFNSDVPRQFFATLGFESHLSLVAKSTPIRTPVKRKVVRYTSKNEDNYERQESCNYIIIFPLFY